VQWYWRNVEHAHNLLVSLQVKKKDVGFSAAGFCGIPYREKVKQLPMF
jgi:hypothetical protein